MRTGDASGSNVERKINEQQAGVTLWIFETQSRQRAGEPQNSGGRAAVRWRGDRARAEGDDSRCEGTPGEGNRPGAPDAPEDLDGKELRAEPIERDGRRG
jgi:hypothetical protein